MTLNQNAQESDITKQIPAEELSTLLKVSSALATSLDLALVLQTAIDATVEILSVDTGAVYMLEDDHLYLGATSPTLEPSLRWLLQQSERLIDHPHLQQSFVLKQPIYITDSQVAKLSLAEKAICDVRHLRSIMYIPLLHEEKPIGALIVGTVCKIREFTEHEINLCRTLSYQISLAVANARLFKTVKQYNIDLTRAYDATLLGWSMALEMRDHDTQGHANRVVEFTDDLAEKMGILEPERVQIRRGAMLHDIGKMGISDAILKKPGPLTAEEWVIMRKHPEFAYQFLIAIDYLKPALDIPYCHHEKWDGSGYPRGLKGEQIPLSARIFAVADVYDALTSDRPYRKALKKEDALLYISQQVNQHFDPVVAQMFLS